MRKLLHLVVVLVLLTGGLVPAVAAMPCCVPTTGAAASMPGMTMGQGVNMASTVGSCAPTKPCDVAAVVAEVTTPVCDQPMCAATDSRQAEPVQVVSVDTGAPSTAAVAHKVLACQGTFTVRRLVPASDPLRSTALPLRV